MAERIQRVYFNEFNVLMDNTVYLPFATGLLYAYARISPDIVANYEFVPFLFYRDIPEHILEKYNNPSIAAFSTGMWNEQLNLYIAEKVKQRFPKCLIVFGGPQITFSPTEYYRKYSFIDITVRGDGEKPFRDILLRAINSRDFSNIPGISWREQNTKQCITNSQEVAFNKDLDEYPSTYLEGLYEYLFTENKNLKFQVIIATNR